MTSTTPRTPTTPLPRSLSLSPLQIPTSPDATFQETYDDHQRVLLTRACEWAVESVKRGGGPFGCVIVDAMGRVVAEGHNQVTLTNDPTAHAEITVIREACRLRETTTLPDCVLYSSCEPCPMCLAATYWAGIPEVVYACTQRDADKAGFADEYLYQEFLRPASHRQCRMRELCTNNKMDAFTLWNSQDVDVVAYGKSPRTV